MGASRSGISVSNEASKVLRGAEAVPYTRSELEAEVEKTLTSLFIGDRDDVAFEELYAQMCESDERVMASGKDAVTAALDAMETANKVMHREGHIHLI